MRFNIAANRRLRPAFDDYFFYLIAIAVVCSYHQIDLINGQTITTGQPPFAQFGYFDWLKRIWPITRENVQSQIQRDTTYVEDKQQQPIEQTGYPSSSAGSRRINDFQIIWNVPSFQCHKYGLNFSEVAEWGILQNAADTFRGDRIALLYDPGYFPALLEANEQSDFVRRNGGVPQEGNLTAHLELFLQQINNKLIPDEKFSGVAIIDFEHWRPVWNENFGSLLPYRKVSRTIEQNTHPFWNEKQIEKESSTRFEKSGWQFFRTTLRLAKQLRPNAKWGYYGFPLCFNYTPRNNYPTCSASVRGNNERIKWLFQDSTAVYPSLYYKKNDMTEESRLLFMKGRMAEAIRVSQMSTVPPPVYPYTWLKYYDTKELVNKNDLLNSFAIPKREGAAGAIIWGASNDVNTEKKCRSLNNYVQSVLGPVTKLVLQTPKEDVHTLISKIPEKRPITTDKNDLLSNVINHLRNL